MCDHIFEQLQMGMREQLPDVPQPVFVIDGTVLQLAHERKLVKAYPPGRNQHGDNHWPMMLLVAFHDVHTGLATRPSWGAMYGPRPVSEQELAREALQRLPADAVVLADGNFGIFAFAYAVQQTQRPMLLRLTAARAQKVLGANGLGPGRHRKVKWEASRWERKEHPDLPEGAVVKGWVVACRNPARQGEILYFFTTLDLKPRRILALYKLRWNIETDLRSLKRTVGLHQVTSKSPAMVEKDVLMAVCAYNVVRAVMYLSASAASLTPRQLSFSTAQDAVMAAWPYLQHAHSQAEWHDELQRLLRVVAQTKLPNPFSQALLSTRDLGARRTLPLPPLSQQGGPPMTATTSVRMSLDSTTLTAVAYDDRCGELQLDFRDGARYAYSGVTPELFRDLLCATSKGSFFNRYIRGRFPYGKLMAEN
jgi:hypothetical protein